MHHLGSGRQRPQLSSTQCPSASKHSLVEQLGRTIQLRFTIEEARSILPEAIERIESTISIGTGLQQPQNFGDGMLGVLRTLKTMSTETQRTHERFLKAHRNLGLNGRYFRFNVGKGLEDVRLDDHAKTGIIEAATRAYLAASEVQTQAAKVASILPPNDHDDSYVHSDLSRTVDQTFHY